MQSGAHAGFLDKIFHQDTFLTKEQLLRQMNQNIAALNRALAAQGQSVQVYNTGTTGHTVMQLSQEGQFCYKGGPDGITPLPEDEPNSGGLWAYITSFFNANPPKKSVDPGVGGYVLSHKQEIAGRAAILWYFYINYSLFTLRNRLYDVGCWSYWRHDLSLVQLLETPQSQLAKQLNAELQRRYGKLGEGLSVTEFLHDLDEEQDALNRYRKLVHVLLRIDEVKCKVCGVCGDYMPKVLGLSTGFIMNFIAARMQIKKLFYIDEELLAIVPERLSKIAYLRNIFAQTLLEQKPTLRPENSVLQ